MTDVSKLASKIVNLDRSKGFVDNFDSLLDFALFMFMANPSQYERENFANHQQDEGYLEALQMIGAASSLNSRVANDFPLAGSPMMQVELLRRRSSSGR